MKIGNWRVPGTYLTHLYQWVRLHRRAIPWSWHTGRPRRQLEEFWRTPPKGGALRVDFWWFWASHPPEVLKKYVTITSRYLWVDRRAIKLANFSLLCMIQPFNFGFWRPKFMKRWISPGFLCWGVFAKVQGKTKRCPTTWLGLIIAAYPRTWNGTELAKMAQTLEARLFWKPNTVVLFIWNF